MPSKNLKRPSTPFPDAIVCDTLQLLFTSLLDAVELCARDGRELELLARALLKLEVVNKGIRALIHENDRLRYYRFFYHTTFYHATTPRRFLDGVFNVSLLHGDYGQGPPQPERFDVLTARQILQDRVNTAKRLTLLNMPAVVQKSRNYLATDLPVNTGPRIRAFVGRARFLTQRRAATVPESVCTCQLATCSRQFLCDAATPGAMQPNPVLDELFGDTLSESDHESDDGVQPIASYWSSLSPKPLTTLPKRVFCSARCAAAYEAELTTAVPVTIANAEFFEERSSASTKRGLARLLASVRAAYKRNDAAARALREALRTVKKRPVTTIKLELFVKMHQNIVDVLNIDLGILSAAAVLAEAGANACVGRVLPATSSGWREEDVRRWRRAIERVKALYLKYYRNEGLACDERFPPHWLAKCKAEADNLFPVL